MYAEFFFLIISLVPSMFGRDLIEQVQTDSRGDDRQVPILVEKCIQAVEAIGAPAVLILATQLRPDFSARL